jgi:hypothetical protein
LAKQPRRACRDTLPWLISVSLDTLAKATAAFLSIGTVRSRRGAHPQGKVWTPLTRFRVTDICSPARKHSENTLDFIQVPGFPSAIRISALTHSRRNVVQR